MVHIIPGSPLQPDEEPRCPFLHCFAGGGVAGNGSCFLGGDPRDPNCPMFEDEEKTCAIFDYEAEMDWIAGNIEFEMEFPPLGKGET